MLTLSPRRCCRIVWLIAFAALASCAEKPQPQGQTATPVFAADLTGGAKQCTASHPTLADGKTAEATMQVDNAGGWCAISVRLDGRPYAAGLLTEPPAHGTVFIHPVGDDTRIDYTPERGFAGTDHFAVQLIPGNPAIRATVTVTR